MFNRQDKNPSCKWTGLQGDFEPVNTIKTPCKVSLSQGAFKFIEPVLYDNPLTFNLNPKPNCFNHYSTIGTFFEDAILIDSKTPFQISHNRELEEEARGLIKNKRTIEDYDDLGNVVKQFRTWLSNAYNKPKILHAHGFDEFDNEISATWEAMNRFQSNRNIKPLSEALNNYKGPGVFLTLTVDHKKVPSLKDAWKNIAEQWHLFIKKLRKELKQKKLNYIWVLEAQGNGYPHIHALFLGIDYLYYAGNKQEWINDNPHSKNLKHFWNWGSVFVNSTKSNQSVKNPINYMMKYIRKTFEPYSNDNKKELTQALLWAFNKRSWNTSRGIFQFLDYEERIPSIELELVEMDTFERLKGQSTPYVRIVNVKPNKTDCEAYKPCDYFSTSDEDLNYLAETVSLNKATVEEIKALDYLTHCRERGLDVRYVIRPKLSKNLIFKKYTYQT